MMFGRRVNPISTYCFLGNVKGPLHLRETVFSIVVNGGNGIFEPFHSIVDMKQS